MRRIFASICIFVLAACSGIAFSDRHYDLDPPNHSLHGHTANDDLDESKCDPIKKPDGRLEYQCVVHFFPDYKALVDENARLRDELKACQSAKAVQ